MIEPNVPLLLKTLHQIETNRELWYQSDWGVDFCLPEAEDGACGTKFCFAGWGVQLSGGEFYSWTDTFTGRKMHDYSDVKLTSLPPGIQEKVRDLADARGHVPTSATASALFGIDRAEGNRLFSAGNTMGALRMQVQHIVNRSRGVVERTDWHLVTPEDWQDECGDFHIAQAQCDGHEWEDCLIQAYLDSREPDLEQICMLRLVLGGENIKHESKGASA